ncbi:hypothetical protein BRD56_05315 [Thermoplasmatales archaeon SW_10_69_26]|nr:MAG: hypothetical protein BRD56_05315 [Thermoplasmatales archaeon SW_10_69_26]
MTSCVACEDGDGTEVPAELGFLEVPFLCADCRQAAQTPPMDGSTFTLPREREAFLEHRENVLGVQDETDAEVAA